MAVVYRRDIDMTTTEFVQAHHASIKRLGNWTAAGKFELQARDGAAVLDLRSPAIPDRVEIRLDLHRGLVKLLLSDDAAVEHWDLRWTGKGRVKDGQRPAGTGRVVRLIGSAADSEIRVYRGGVAVLSALCSRDFLRDARRAHRAGEFPIVHDPARTAG
jgi:hypothetical protein